MDRLISIDLMEWQQSSNRKPLILRGARQVGKTHAVRQLGQRYKQYVEINFELLEAARGVFESNLDPKRLIRDLSLIIEKPIIPGETLLFLDEIQEAPKGILALRYFYEQIPELHVIAAGSLIDFALEQVSLPVGRVNFLYMHPMSFCEFLFAIDQSAVVHALIENNGTPFSAPVHEKCLNLLGQYLAIGGMPEAVKFWRDTRDLKIVGQVHQELITAYEQDFQKYAKKLQIKYVDLIFRRFPQQLGERFVYSKITSEYRKRELAPAFDLLEKAGILHRVSQSSGHGLPLAAEASIEVFKPLGLDIALSQALLGLPLKDWILNSSQNLINKGNITEAFIGQELLAYANPRTKAELYYWHRMERSSSAEVDYLIEQQGSIIPVEVKSGTGGQMKSMHLFLDKYPNSPYGLRLSQDNFQRYQKVHTYPLYALVSAIPDLKLRLQDLSNLVNRTDVA